ncbi:NUDIX hydrolase [Fictibacillus sp. Sa2CUA10]|uniref:NUDIX hydrolase n=2 Tax=Fictibacillus norfolkensis TaxID=2762233 RepID=A0ABR8SR60_9BACL|nr:NUDIX hydrolase [Fictibacillus norfolkensis]MBD7965988.1 NUDIX hydrolase [Fictibacillus norfolkensis]
MGMKWEGASCICVNDGKLLMVLQGTADEEKKWSIPSGGRERNESIEECGMREVWEETGYVVKVVKKLHIKEGISQNIQFKVHYFLTDLVSGFSVIQDPDGLIHDIRWVSLKELETLTLSFPEDRELLQSYLAPSEKII